MSYPQITKAFKSWVGISETIRFLFAIVIILFYLIISFIYFDLNFIIYINASNFNNLPITIYPLDLTNNIKFKKDIHFNEWLAGLIDGGGYFYIRKENRLTSLVITFDSRDKKTAQMIKNRLNGKLQKVKGSNAIRFLLHKHDDIVLLINNLNGLIRTENRIKQFKLVV